MIDRTRTVRWEDPAPGAEAAREMGGLEYLRAMLGGELPGPPIARLVGFDLLEVEEGRAVFECEPAEYHYNPIGSVHGGLACTLLDSAMGCAIHTELPAGVGYTTVELKVNFLRPITTQTRRLLCEGTAIHVGGRIATAEARLTDESGRLYGHATTTCMIFRDGARSVGEGEQ
ncbi:MAG: PaaI family thioesterase [Actinomycetota bacterium]|nr:PaaI family thioesterase [Actinomycetota bacterium]